MGSGRSEYARSRYSAGTNSWRGTDRMAASTAGSCTPRASICQRTMCSRSVAQSITRRSQPVAVPNACSVAKLAQLGEKCAGPVTPVRVRAEQGLRLLQHADGARPVAGGDPRAPQPVPGEPVGGIDAARDLEPAG